MYALAVTQIISWGTMFYAFSVLLASIEQEMHWSRDAIVGAFSLSVLMTGLAAAPVGALVDRIGGRMVMSLGSLFAAAILLLMSLAHSLTAFYVEWAALGLAGAMLLYEPAFAVIYRTFAANARKALTALTLLGGFSSTIFWPLTQVLVTALGWRHTLIALGLMNLLVCLPLHALMLPRKRAMRSHVRTASGAAANVHTFATILRTKAFWLLALAFTANILAFASLSVHLIALLQEKGFESQHAVWLAALVGPMQVSGRLMEFTVGRRLSPEKVGLLAMSVLPAGLVALVFASSSWLFGVLFVVCYGASNGVMTIVRATLPAEMFGRENYGAANGALAAPVIVTRAGAPLAASLLWTASGGYNGVLWVLAASAVLATVLFYFAIRDSRAA